MTVRRSPVLAEGLTRSGLGFGHRAVGGIQHQKQISRPEDRQQGYEISGELHAQYTVSYRPSGTDPVAYHEIKV